MKRSLISILIAFLIMAAYHLVAMVAGPILTGGPPMTIPAGLYTPISLPARIYRAIMPDSIQMVTLSTPGVEPLLFFIGNVVLLSILIFLILSLFAKKRD